jgi:hypothetical protein
MEFEPIEQRSSIAAGDFMPQYFQIITWSLFGVLLIAYIAVKMSKRKSNQNQN